MKLETTRLTLRNLKDSDLEAYCRMQGTRFVRQYNAMGDLTREKAAELLARHREDDGWLAVARREDGAFLGMVYLSEDSLRYQVNSIEISYWLGEEYARRGYMTEALQAIIGWLFGEKGCASVTARCFAPNTASIALLQKLGFREEGRLRRAVRAYEGKVYDDVLFSLEREAWKGDTP